MKKRSVVLVVLLVFIGLFLFGCMLSDPELTENHKLLIGEWEYDFEGCAYELTIGENGGFSLWCACGNPVGSSNLVKSYKYDDKKKEITLYGVFFVKISTGKVHKISQDELIVTFFGEKCTFKRVIPDKFEKFDAANQEETEEYKTILGSWECEHNGGIESLSFGKDHKLKSSCTCGECSDSEKYYIYNEGYISLYDAPGKICYFKSPIEILNEDEIKYDGNMYKRVK